jgi:hypothetical protein
MNAKLLPGRVGGGAMNTCLLAGARASSRFGIGEGVKLVLAGRRDGLAVGGKAVIVCDVEVIEDVVLPVLAIVAFYNPVVVRLFREIFSISMHFILSSRDIVAQTSVPLLYGRAVHRLPNTSWLVR